jgi:hypothetical protein
MSTKSPDKSLQATRDGGLSSASRFTLVGPAWLSFLRQASMKRILLPVTLAALTFMQAGCTFARYTQVRVQVVDEQTNAGIPKARVRTFYVKPAMDMTYQRKDREKTDAGGFATLTVATNWSQRMILGWTYGIIPHLAVQADGYRSRQVGVSHQACRGEHMLIPLGRMSRQGRKPELSKRHGKRGGDTELNEFSR